MVPEFPQTANRVVAKRLFFYYLRGERNINNAAQTLIIQHSSFSISPEP